MQSVRGAFEVIFWFKAATERRSGWRTDSIDYVKSAGGTDLGTPVEQLSQICQTLKLVVGKQGVAGKLLARRLVGSLHPEYSAPAPSTKRVESLGVSDEVRIKIFLSAAGPSVGSLACGDLGPGG